METNLQLSKHCNPRARDVQFLNNVFHRIKKQAPEKRPSELSVEANKIRKRTSSFLKFHNPQRKFRIKDLRTRSRSDVNGGGEERHHRRHRRWIQMKTQSIAAANGQARRVQDGQPATSACYEKSFLETHVWHAKRMIMKDMFKGHVLPTRHKTHSYKHAKQALFTNAIVFDASFYVTIELSGLFDDMISTLSCFFNVRSFHSLILISRRKL